MQSPIATPAGSPVPGQAPGEGHTARSVDQSLAGLRLSAVEMGGLVIDQVARAADALLGRDTAMAESVLSREPLVNDYDTRLDEDSLKFIALQQPVANDLRMTRAIARAALELERAGDEAKKIARFAARIGTTPGHDPVVAVARHLRHMATLSVSLLRDAVRALDEASPDRARAVLARDPELDTEFANAIRQVMSFVMEDRQFLSATVETVFALKGLERIGDHAKNIAEQVIYMVEGARA